MLEDGSLTILVTAIALILIGPAIGVWTAKGQTSVASDSEGDLRFGSLVTGLSAAASGNSAFILVGAVGLGYVMGLSALWIPFGFWLGDIIFWYFVAHRLISRVQETGVETIGELVSQQSGEYGKVALRTAALLVILAMGMFCVAQFLAVGKILLEVFDITPVLAMALAVVVGLLSVLFGGLGSSMNVNVYQSILMILAALILIFSALLASPQDFSALSTHTESNRLLDPFYGFSPPLFLLFVITFVLQGLLFAMCNPHVLARITKGDVDSIPRIRWVYMGFMQSLWWLMTLVGVALALQGLMVEDPDRAGFALVDSVASPILVGIFVAGIAAASLSTGEAQMLVIANALTLDMLPKTLTPDLKLKLKFAGRIAVALGLFLMLTNMDFDLIGKLVIQASSLVLSGFALPAILFILNRPLDGRVMSGVILLGAGSAFATRALFDSLPPAHEIYSGLVVASVVFLAGSYLFPLRSRTR